MNVVSQTVVNSQALPILFGDDKLMTIAISDQNNVNYTDPGLFSVIFTIYHLKTNDQGIFTLDYQLQQELKPCTINDVAFNPNLIVKIVKTFLLEVG